MISGTTTMILSTAGMISGGGNDLEHYGKDS
jgi:hypothetical protein